MDRLTFKLNISTIHKPKFILQLQFDCGPVGFLHTVDFDGTLASHTLWGKDYDIYLPDEIDTINFDYDRGDKLVIPGIWNLSIFDDNSFLDELFFELNASNFVLPNGFVIDIKKPIKALLYRITGYEVFQFPLDYYHIPFFSGIVYMKSLGFDEVTKLFSLSVQPDVELLKKTEIRTMKAYNPNAQEIPDTFLSMKDNLYYLLQVALPNITRDNIIIQHDFVFCAHSNPNHSFNSSDPNTIVAAGSIGEYTINDILFNPRDIANRLGTITYPDNKLKSITCHDLLKILCFSFFATLTITHNKAVFASMNKSFSTDKTFNANRSVSSFKKELSFESLEWIRITEVSSTNNITYSFTLGTESKTTNGFDKSIVFITDMLFTVNGGLTKYILTSPFKVRYSDNSLLHVIFAKANSTTIYYKTFRKLIATLWFDYMNVFTSGRFYNFQISSLDFDFSYSLGYQDRLYSPVSIHYNLVDVCTDVEAVRN